MPPLHIKIYGSFYPVPTSLMETIKLVGADAMGHEEPWLFLEGDMVRISFEGLYFPWEDLVSTLNTHLAKSTQGKLDVLALDEWKLYRHIWENGHLTKTVRNLNDILEPAANFR